MDLKRFNQLLKLTVDRALEKTEVSFIIIEKYFHKSSHLSDFQFQFIDFKAIASPSREIINPMDLNEIKRKVDQSIYKSTSEFTVDFKWIHHNSKIDNERPGKNWMHPCIYLLSYC